MAARQVVVNDRLKSLGGQRFAGVTADVPGAAGDKNLHDVVLACKAAACVGAVRSGSPFVISTVVCSGLADVLARINKHSIHSLDQLMPEIGSVRPANR